MVNIICVKTGSKYTSSYVNRLYSMCKTHVTKPFNFYCYTDNPSEIGYGINIIPFDDYNLSSAVYNKLYLFSEKFAEQLAPSTQCLFFDLDVVIKSNIDDLVESRHTNLRVISSSWKPTTGEGRCSPVFDHSINSSCMSWSPEYNFGIWKHFMKSPQRFMDTYTTGMDAYLHYEHGIVGGLPERLFYSFLHGINLKITRVHKDPLRLEELRNTIPIVLFNGRTTEQDILDFISSSYQLQIQPGSEEHLRRYAKTTPVSML